MAYFHSEVEALHLAVSEDGLKWQPLDHLNPVLLPDEPIKSIRDPYIGLGIDGRFHLLATHGWVSTAIVHAVSNDMINWSVPDLVNVMGTVSNARNAWAPEFFIDEEASEHIVIWSSSTEPLEQGWDSFEAVTTQTHDHRIWSSRSADFKEWSLPHIWFDPGYTVIDATVARHNGRWIMAFKDERGTNERFTEYKGIRIAGFDRPNGPFDEPSEIVSCHLAEGPTFVKGSETIYVLFDRFMDNQFGGIELSDELTWNHIDNLDIPPKARHAAVIEVDMDIYQNLLSEVTAL